MQIVILPLILLLTSCAVNKTAPLSLIDEPAKYGDWGIETEFFSQSVKPGDDFYTYVNAGWLSDTTLPEGLSQLSAFNQLARETRAQTNKIIQQTPNYKGQTNMHKRVANLLRSYIDQGLREQLGLEPIQADIERLKSLSNKEQVAEWMADPRSNALVDIFIWLDAKDSSKHVVQMDQIKSRKVIGMPNKTYYVRTEEPYLRYQKAYIDYIEKTLRKAGVEEAEQKSIAVYSIERKLAEAMWEPAQIRDRKANYHPMSVEELYAFAPGFPWQIFLAARGLKNIDQLILGTDTAVQKSVVVFADSALDDWKAYLVFHWVNNHRYLLSEKVAEDAFEFYGRTLSGVSEQRSMEERGIRFVNRYLGHQVGQLYVAQHFPNQYKKRIEYLIGYVRRAFEEKLAQQDWMDSATKQKALHKLSRMQVKLGYPETWRDRTGLTIKADDLVGNYQRIVEHDWQLELKRLNKAYPDGDWWMNPQTVDASFSPQLNRITFPAGILQPPFFDPMADVAVNFGAIGSIIGHEMGHGFDDQGSRFDADGVLQNWWSEASHQAFKAKSLALVNQYNAYSPLPGLLVNGEQTLGENMADLIGVSIAHRAYQLYLIDHKPNGREHDRDFSGDQQFFLAWAQANRTLWNTESLEKQLLNGHHTPGQYRVNGVVRNIDAWYEAFQIKTGHELYLPPEDRVKLW
ncbi:M13 family metallopeptidase [Marinicella sp. W31]|uniref:M13 family metallopeptidase n=1 Tax=Marinicella sp. W31 TaxID=3023713 RepID=UPI0037564CBA